ncbi:dihydroorotase [Bdellovibrio bacteriovorus]|uniref:Dihydroorotase n=1 Tax=Bdellovibrio bacteriovorus TaxID=959 RepID=A0A150WM73_BDEBC|nr:dihydroorotase [Bdellovibrio bacteriovorus]KYG65591.1 dihydroorotase [Bdellovibrio bacteriovorus]
MKTYDLILKGGTCLLPNPSGTGLIEQLADVAISNGRIEKIADLINEPAAKVMNLKGLHVLPGVIDSQVHFREPGLEHKEDLETGTRAAVLGGVTTIFEMPNTNPSTTTKEAFEDKLNRAKNRAHANYAFFMGGAHDNVDKIAQLEMLPHCSGVKIFMGSSTGTLLVEDDDTLEKILMQGHRRVIFHSEDEMRLRERKHIAVEKADPHFHHVWRDVETAVNSTRRLLRLARKTGRRIHVLHISTGDEMEMLKEAKDIATVEVLPQHLTLFAPDCYDKLGTYAQQNPPIREKHHLERIWKAVLDGTVDVIGSDHAPHTKEEKNRPYPASPSGVPGVQTLVPIMLNHVHEGRMPLKRFVEMVTENPRKVFGVKNKGRLEVGYDADITVVDLKKKKTITNDWIASRCGWTPFDGMQVTGWPTHTIVGGHIVMENDQVVMPSMGQAVDFIETSK